MKAQKNKGVCYHKYGSILITQLWFSAASNSLQIKLTLWVRDPSCRNLLKRNAKLMRHL